MTIKIDTTKRFLIFTTIIIAIAVSIPTFNRFIQITKTNNQKEDKAVFYDKQRNQTINNILSVTSLKLLVVMRRMS